MKKAILILIVWERKRVYILYTVKAIVHDPSQYTLIEN